MYVLQNAVRDYSWGSKTHIPRLLGAAASATPVAELWIGAHDGDPSTIAGGRRLNDVIRDDPEAMLGPSVVARFGPRLPFLLKALAAAEPLSLQVHPTSERARMGFADQDRRGIPLAASERSYQDPWHKPELVFALTRFEGMAGFRDVDKSAQILRLLGLPWADEVAHRLESGPAFQALRSVVTDLLSLSGANLSNLLGQLGDAARRAEARSHREDLRRRPPAIDRTSVERESRRVFAQTSALAERYPHDPGVLVTTLLNHVVLAPGEAMFLSAGIIHAYTSGFGVEVMAASDNVVRAGLTPKHVDRAELLEITNFTPIPPPLWSPTDVAGSAAIHLDPPVSEFALTIGAPPCPATPERGPRILFVLEGSVQVKANGRSETLRQGQAMFVPHSDGAVTTHGDGRVATVGVPD